MPCEVVRTHQGAWAIRDLQTGEIMHPGVGPLVEAQRLYVEQSRLAERLQRSSRPLILFDVGLGAGSNAAAAWKAAEQLPEGAAPLEIISFERDLSALRLALDSADAFALQGPPGQAARALLERGECETAKVRWRLHLGDALSCMEACSERADLVFWDPFSPSANPELWTLKAFATLFARVSDAATLYTYSTSTTVRIALLLAGFCVGEGVSIGSKATTTAAAVNLHDLAAPLGKSFLSRVTRPDVRLPADAPPDALARVLACPQFR